jgi:hypothetical protein
MWWATSGGLLAALAPPALASSSSTGECCTGEGLQLLYFVCFSVGWDWITASFVVQQSIVVQQS